mmetsp:Transcript_80541/g.127206  ORF Transcript_80541/g.127206 Transcript_80541/m.127206 type:complete len:275 (-) Transcript_80541:154-978(-)
MPSGQFTQTSGMPPSRTLKVCSKLSTFSFSGTSPIKCSRFKRGHWHKASRKAGKTRPSWSQPSMTSTSSTLRPSTLQAFSSDPISGSCGASKPTKRKGSSEMAACSSCKVSSDASENQLYPKVNDCRRRSGASSCSIWATAASISPPELIVVSRSSRSCFSALQLPIAAMRPPISFSSCTQRNVRDTLSKDLRFSKAFPSAISRLLLLKMHLVSSGTGLDLFRTSSSTPKGPPPSSMLMGPSSSKLQHRAKRSTKSCRKGSLSSSVMGLMLFSC